MNFPHKAHYGTLQIYNWFRLLWVHMDIVYMEIWYYYTFVIKVDNPSFRNPEKGPFLSDFENIVY